MAEQNQELQIQIQTIDFTPAIVKFNAEQISAILDEQLAKYQGLTFTEDKEAEAKKVIAELNKAKKMLDTYRKETKAKLTASVTDFEDEIKKLAAKFDAVIGPLTEQTAQFEADRRQKKRTEIEGLIAGLIIEHELDPQFAAKLVYPEEYLNRTVSIKSITFDLQAEAEKLKGDQDRLANELQLICGSVELANQAIPGFGFLDTTYTRLLGQLTLQQVLTRINEDVTAVKERNAQAAAREEKRLADEASVAESNRLAAESAAKVQFVAPSSATTSSMPRTAPGVEDIRGTPRFEDIHPLTADPQRFVETYQVTGSQAQLDSLEAFFEQYGFEWKIIE